MKLTTIHAERCPPDQHRHIDAECPHVEPIRRDDKSHILWLTGYFFQGDNFILLNCDHCTAEVDAKIAEDPAADLVWRIPFRPADRG